MIGEDGKFVDRADWFMRAIIAGFAATVTMSLVLVVAYGVALLLGSDSANAPLILRWIWSLAHNTVAQQTATAVPGVILLHFVFGIAWAVVYARFAEPHLSGPGWRRGLIFSPLPGLLSLLVFLPLVGGGILGLGLGAGPLPIIGNLLVHAVYGATLGYVYLPQHAALLLGDGEEANPVEVGMLYRSERLTALGIILGLAVGALVGWVVGLIFAPNAGGLLGLLFGALGGSILGLFIGSYSGLSEWEVRS